MKSAPFAVGNNMTHREECGNIEGSLAYLELRGIPVFLLWDALM